MQRILILALVLCFGCSMQPIQQPTSTYGRGGDIYYTGDGRIQFWSGGGWTQKVELIGIKMPTEGDKCFKMSRLMFYRLTLSKRLRLEYDTLQSGVNSLLVYAYLHDGTMVNAEMIRRGYAWAVPTPPNDKYDVLFSKLEAEAREQKRGIWQYQRPLF